MTTSLCGNGDFKNLQIPVTRMAALISVRVLLLLYALLLLIRSVYTVVDQHLYWHRMQKELRPTAMDVLYLSWIYMKKSFPKHYISIFKNIQKQCDFIVPDPVKSLFGQLKCVRRIR